MGVAAFRRDLEARLGYALETARAFRFTDNGDRPGWVEGDDGNWHFTLPVENGRIVDRGARRLLSGLDAIAPLGTGRFIITPNQNLVLASIDAERKSAVEELLHAHGLDGPMSGLRRSALACVALPTCGLALAESERYLPELLTRLEQEAERAGLAHDDITVRMTGCPNGCARPYLAEIGLVGRAPGVYNLYLGGAHDGTRLNKLFRKDVGHDAIIGALVPLMHEYAQRRTANERFGDFVIRAGHVRATIAGNQFHSDVQLEAGN
jgi:sulfite reductase (NADPH) hemoprotein beta-component